MSDLFGKLQTIYLSASTNKWLAVSAKKKNGMQNCLQVKNINRTYAVNGIKWVLFSGYIVRARVHNKHGYIKQVLPAFKDLPRGDHNWTEQHKNTFSWSTLMEGTGNLTPLSLVRGIWKKFCMYRPATLCAIYLSDLHFSVLCFFLASRFRWKYVGWDLYLKFPFFWAYLTFPVLRNKVFVFY